MSYVGPWRNRPFHVYTQFCFIDELQAWDKKLYSLIIAHGAAFDDSWHYYKGGKSRIICARKPLWLDIKEGGGFTEKPKQKSNNHSLEEFLDA